jgi:hypothetical protein
MKPFAYYTDYGPRPQEKEFLTLYAYRHGALLGQWDYNKR